jgi:hypothetical protein
MTGHLAWSTTFIIHLATVHFDCEEDAVDLT